MPSHANPPTHGNLPPGARRSSAITLRPRHQALTARPGSWIAAGFPHYGLNGLADKDMVINLPFRLQLAPIDETIMEWSRTQDLT